MDRGSLVNTDKYGLLSLETVLQIENKDDKEQ